MFRWERRKMSLIIHCLLISAALCKSIEPTDKTTTDPAVDTFDNNIIDFDEDYSVKYDKKYGRAPWESKERFNKEINRYTLVRDTIEKQNVSNVQTETNTQFNIDNTTAENDYSVIPLELISTTEDALISMIESTMEPDLTVIPLSTTRKTLPEIEIKQTVTLPSSTQSTDTTTEYLLNEDKQTDETTTIKREVTFDKNIETTTNKKEVVTTIDKNIETTTAAILKSSTTNTEAPKITSTIKAENTTTSKQSTTLNNNTELDSTTFIAKNAELTTEAAKNTTARDTHTKTDENLETNSTKEKETVKDGSGFGEDVETEIDGLEETEVPEDYYDSKDIVPTTAPKTDALSVIFGLAGSVVESVVESVAERVVPKSIFDLFKRMQKQNEALEAERLRSREENGGIGQFGRGILKSISSGLSKPLSQLMQGVKDFGSLDTDRGFVSSLASGVSSVATAATSIADTFKDRVQAIYPGTVWCGDGHSATARSSDLGLFFFTDTCCREHDACKIYIKAGDTKYGLTNTGLFTRSHCSCDAKFRDCLRKTNSLVSTQIGLTYFNVLGPQCFRKAHPIVRCVRKTRITGQKCEEYELDYTKPKMWQWFDNETY